jgi:hypothetical protein
MCTRCTTGTVPYVYSPPNAIPASKTHTFPLRGCIEDLMAHAAAGGSTRAAKVQAIMLGGQKTRAGQQKALSHAHSNALLHYSGACEHIRYSMCCTRSHHPTGCSARSSTHESVEQAPCPGCQTRLEAHACLLACVQSHQVQHVLHKGTQRDDASVAALTNLFSKRPALVDVPFLPMSSSADCMLSAMPRVTSALANILPFLLPGSSDPLGKSFSR